MKMTKKYPGIWILGLWAVLNRRFSKDNSASMERSCIQINLFETLKNSFEIDFETYELHKKNKIGVRTPKTNGF
jgi:hypothetical protein